MMLAELKTKLFEIQNFVTKSTKFQMKYINTFKITYGTDDVEHYSDIVEASHKGEARRSTRDFYILPKKIKIRTKKYGIQTETLGEIQTPGPELCSMWRNWKSAP